MPTSEVDSKIRVRISKRTVLMVVRFLLISFVICFSLGSMLLLVALAPVTDSRNSLDKIITIEPGIAGRQVAELLVEEKLVRSANLFKILLRLTKTDARLQAGEYLLNPSMRPLEIIGALNAGNSVTYKVLIPEGSSLKDIAIILAEKGLVDKERFLTLAFNVNQVYDEIPLDIPIDSLEGYLFPDTYRFAKGQSEESIIRHMVDHFVSVVSPVIEEGTKNIDLSFHEIITLASIVEKEVVVDSERPIVAGVYLNRLEINIPLQADPTVRYVMTEERSRVLYKDLEIDSPYNTYRNNNLPPGPIASPGLRSIKAVLEPADVDYLFFVSKGDGTHQFSKTFEEHVQARKALGY